MTKNISKLLLSILLLAGLLFSFSETKAQTYSAGALYYRDINKMKFIYDSVLYVEGWHALPQTKFWQQIMTLTPDSAIVNIAEGRQMLDRICVKDWNKLTESQQNCYRDSIRKQYYILDSSRVYVTIGKKDFYEFKKVMPIINTSIEVFKNIFRVGL